MTDFNVTLCGRRVKFLNPPNNGMPNITFMAELGDDEDPMRLWHSAATKLLIEMNFDVVIIDTKTWITAYAPVDKNGRVDLSRPKLVVVNYRTITSSQYAQMMLSNVIARYPIDNGFEHDGYKQLKYVYTMDFIQHKNKKSPFITNGFVDVVISMVYLPETEKELSEFLCTYVCPDIINKVIAGGIIPHEYFANIETHIVGYNSNSMCVEMVIMVNGIGKISSDYYSIEEISKDYFTIDERFLCIPHSLLMPLSNTALMDEKGFNVLSNLETARESEISSIREPDERGNKMITFIPHFKRINLIDHPCTDDKFEDKENEYNYFRLRSLFEVYDWCSVYSTRLYHQYEDDMPVLIVKVGRDKLSNDMPKPTEQNVTMKLFAANSSTLWYAWFRNKKER